MEQFRALILLKQNFPISRKVLHLHAPGQTIYDLKKERPIYHVAVHRKEKMIQEDRERL